MGWKNSINMIFHVFSKNVLVFALILAVRLSGVCLIQTAFVPDEYWQSLEVAHEMTFRYGYLTWEWKRKIRSCIYPLMFHILYSIFPDSVTTIVILPKIFQAILSSIGDFFTYKLSSKSFGSNCGKWTLFNILTSWFLFYCASRTLTNMAEASFTACGFYFYPWIRGKHRRLTCNYLWFVGASILIRPTAAVLWSPLYVYHFWRETHFTYIIKKTIMIGSTFLAFLLLCDRWYYGAWVLTPLNFFTFNWSNDIGAFYGQHNFLWYFFIGLPAVLGVHIIPFILGLTLKQTRPFSLLILWVIFIFSVPSHKEFRFLLPILPLVLIICSVLMNEIAYGRLVIFGYKVNKNVNVALTSAILMLHIPITFYMSVFHQRGTIDAVQHLSKEVDKNSNVLFLMPCHSTPYYSYIHQNISMKFLTCEPNFDNINNYTEEADVFFQNPELWLLHNYNFNTEKNIPTHIVMYDSLYKYVSDFLEKYNYHLCYNTLHSFFPEKRIGRYVNIYCRKYVNLLLKKIIM